MRLGGRVRGGSRPHAVACPACAYDLSGAAGGRCPECGAAFSEADLDVLRAAPLWREQYIRDSARIVAGACFLFILLALLMAAVHGRSMGRAFAARSLYASLGLLAAGLAGGPLALVGARRGEGWTLSAVWWRTSPWLYMGWCVGLGTLLFVLPWAAYRLVAIFLGMVALALVGVGFASWRSEWKRVSGELEFSLSGARWGALQAVAVVVALAGGVISVVVLLTSATRGHP